MFDGLKQKFDKLRNGDAHEEPEGLVQGEVPIEEEPAPEAPREVDAVDEAMDEGESESVMFCNELCSERDTCPTRLGFIRLAQGFNILNQAHESDDEVQDVLDTMVPGLEAFEATRNACADNEFGLHQERLRQKEELKPALQEAMRELGGHDPDAAQKYEDRFKSIESSLEKLRNDILSKLDAAAARPPAAASTAGQVPHAVPAGRAPFRSAQEKQEKKPQVSDEEAAVLIAEYRERYPNDDAEACRNLVKETGVSQGQFVRIAKVGKATVSGWVNNPNARASTSLNAERSAKGTE